MLVFDDDEYGPHPKELIKYLNERIDGEMEEDEKAEFEKATYEFPHQMPHGLAAIIIKGDKWNVAFKAIPILRDFFHVLQFFSEGGRTTILDTVVFEYYSKAPVAFRDLNWPFPNKYGKEIAEIIVFIAEEEEKYWKEEEKRISREEAHSERLLDEWEDYHTRD